MVSRPRCPCIGGISPRGAGKGSHGGDGSPSRHHARCGPQGAGGGFLRHETARPHGGKSLEFGKEGRPVHRRPSRQGGHTVHGRSPRLLFRRRGLRSSHRRRRRCPPRSGGHPQGRFRHLQGTPSFRLVGCGSRWIPSRPQKHLCRGSGGMPGGDRCGGSHGGGGRDGRRGRDGPAGLRRRRHGVPERHGIGVRSRPGCGGNPLPQQERVPRLPGVSLRGPDSGRV